MIAGLLLPSNRSPLGGVINYQEAHPIDPCCKAAVRGCDKDRVEALQSELSQKVPVASSASRQFSLTATLTANRLVMALSGRRFLGTPFFPARCEPRISRPGGRAFLPPAKLLFRVDGVLFEELIVANIVHRIPARVLDRTNRYGGFTKGSTCSI